MNTEDLISLIFEKRKNLFFSGSGGTGKSTTIKKIKQWADNYEKKCSLTATTGVAAINISGQTFHRWSGIGLGKGSKEELLSQIKKYKKTVERWRTTDILVIDEISMMGAKLFDKVNYIGQQIRKNFFFPFGGIQLIVSGDMLQLPPVHDDFCFFSKVWKECNFQIISFTIPYRFIDKKFY